MKLSSAILQRLEQARESLKEAETLRQSSLFRGTINRAYYAMFYALMALSITKDYSSSKHSGMIAFFDKEFIKTGVFLPELSRSLHLAFDRRQASDYGEMWSVSEEDANIAISDAASFLEAIEAYFQG